LFDSVIVVVIDFFSLAKTITAVGILCVPLGSNIPVSSAPKIPLALGSFFKTQ